MDWTIYVPHFTPRPKWPFIFPFRYIFTKHRRFFSTCIQITTLLNWSHAVQRENHDWWIFYLLITLRVFCLPSTHAATDTFFSIDRHSNGDGEKRYRMKWIVISHNYCCVPTLFNDLMPHIKLAWRLYSFNDLKPLLF